MSKVPVYLERNKRNNISPIAMNEINHFFPTNKAPFFNFKMEVSIDIAQAKSYETTVFVQTTKNVADDIVNAACFVADTWIDGELVENDNLSIVDLGNAKVTVKHESLEKDLVFIVQLDFSCKATNLSK